MHGGRNPGLIIISRNDNLSPANEHALEFLLAFDGRIHHLERGYWLEFEVSRVSPTASRPHGLSYSFTLHGPAGERLVGFDNAHEVPHLGSPFKRHPGTSDHWHRTASDPGRPYAFKDVETLLDDFFEAVERTLREHGIEPRVMRTE